MGPYPFSNLTKLYESYLLTEREVLIPLWGLGEVKKVEEDFTEEVTLDRRIDGSVALHLTGKSQTVSLANKDEVSRQLQM